jgi:hypothetical protein
MLYNYILLCYTIISCYVIKYSHNELAPHVSIPCWDRHQGLLDYKLINYQGLLDYKLIYNLKIPDDDPNKESKHVGLVHCDCIV